MDTSEETIEAIFKAARVGDLDKIRALAEEQLVELNFRDKWDSTPLYYACLCGHEDIVEFMLKNGARCEPNTFDGERCLYAALTQKIKKMLKEYKAITSECMRRDQYQEFLRSCMQKHSFEDIFFSIQGDMIAAHKVIISARCPYLGNLLQTKWRERNIIPVKHLVNPAAFRYFIQYLYVGCLNMPLNQVDDFIVICKQCRMAQLIDEVENAIRCFHSYADTKPEYMRDRVSMISIGGGRESMELQMSFGKIAELCIPDPLRFKQFSAAVPEIFHIMLEGDEDEVDYQLFDNDGKVVYSDVCFIVEGFRFFCHKVFMCGRSDYFKALRHFAEVDEEDCHRNLEVSLNEISADAFAAVVNFIYTDKCQPSKRLHFFFLTHPVDENKQGLKVALEPLGQTVGRCTRRVVFKRSFEFVRKKKDYLKICQITPDIVYELLYFSDLFLLPGLKLQCAACLAQEMTVENVVSILKLARLHELDRLETQCCAFIANSLPEIICCQEFRDLVMEDATTIREREDTDTIQIIDDIRYHIFKVALPGMDVASFDLNADELLAILDNLLMQLGLDA